MIFIDGEELPSINGTGSEDYFNHAWGMQKNQSLYTGTIIHETTVEGYQVSYRFHITDPIHFKTGLKVTMEHGHANHLSDDWASTAYWYQTLPSKGVTIAPVEERIALKKVQEVPEAGEFEMTEEMREAKESSKKRHEKFMAEKIHQNHLNAERTEASSRGNIELSRKVKDIFDGK